MNASTPERPELPVPGGDATEARPCGGLWPGCSNTNCSWPDQPCIVERSSSFDAEEVRYRALRDRKSTVGDETEALRRERLRRAVEDGERLYRKRMHDEPTIKDDFRIDGILTLDLPDALGFVDSLLARVAGLEARATDHERLLQHAVDEAQKYLGRAAQAEAREAALRALANNARSSAAAPDYDEEAIRDNLWALVDAALADSGEAGS